MLLNLAGTTVLIDFGLAGPSGRPGVSGTPGYISPEALAGGDVTPRSDVYSSGAVLALLLQGKPLFAGTTEMEVLAAQARSESPQLSGVAPAIEAVLRRALATDPDARHPDAASFLADLQQAVERDYGDNWLAAAAVAGIVTSIVTASTASGGVALAGGTISAKSGAATHALTAAKTARRVHKGMAVKGAIAGAVAVAAVGVVVVATHHSPTSSSVIYTSGSGTVTSVCPSCGGTTQSGTLPLHLATGAASDAKESGGLFSVHLMNFSPLSPTTADLVLTGFALGRTVVQSNAGLPDGSSRGVQLGAWVRTCN
jgi:hypothetical protein